MSKYVWLLDPGHGGLIKGIYQTNGKRSPLWSDGTQLFEGVFNRNVVNSIADKLKTKNIEYKILVPENEDITLKERVKRANNYNNEFGKRCILISVHSNAGGGSGFEIYTSIGKTKSDSVATEIFNKIKEMFPDMKMRGDFSDSDPDKEEQFYILKNTSMPAVLTENFFMDNELECKLILSDEGVEKIAKAHVNAIISLENALV